MSRTVQLILIVCILVLGGCQVEEKEEKVLPKDMDPTDLPDGRAFEDEFTRSFLQSTEEVMPGYYPFLSGNGLFTMAFPKEGLMGEGGYACKEGDQESIGISVWKEGANISADIQINYYSFLLSNDSEEFGKRNLQKRFNMDLDFEEIKKEGQTLYISYFEKESDTTESIYGYAGYLQNNKERGGIFLIYTSYCDRNCEEEKEADLKQAYDWMQSVTFIQSKHKDGE